MSRLDRLVSLLDTGFSSYIRNVAAEQIADVQKSRPEELFNLLARVTPYLQSSKWDTRIAAAKAVGLIAEQIDWQPQHPLDVESVKCEVKDEVDNDSIKNESDSVEAKCENDILEQSHLLSFDQLDINSVILKGTPLLGSAGREYDQVVQGLDSDERLKMQKRNLTKKIGMDWLGDDDETSGLLDADLINPSPCKPVSKPQNEQKKAPKTELEELPTEHMNARLRALAKRKARFGSPQAPPSKARAIESPSSETASKQPSNEKIVVEFKEKSSDLVAAITVTDPRVFPLEELCYRLMFDMFEPTWETRHGALLCLREIVRVHGSSVGMLKGCVDKETNLLRNSKWLEDLSCRLCCIFALDRFADYVADQAVAPVRESCAQTLGALLSTLSEPVAKQTFGVLQSLLMDHENTKYWAACHGGLLGLRYFVTLRLPLIKDDSVLFSQLVACVFRGLTDFHDDEVQAVSAAVLLPIATNFVTQRPREEVSRLLNIIWACISNMKDELSASIGNIMDLLATLCRLPEVLELLLTGEEHSLKSLVPKLYPFLRHSIIDVRKAVLRSLKTFVNLQNDSKEWISLTTLRLIFQNILLEQNDGVVDLTMELWHSLMDYFTTVSFTDIYNEFWPIAFPLLTTPIGTARRFYHMNEELLIKPGGKSYASAPPASASNNSKLDVNIDGSMIQGDTLVVDLEVFIRVKVNASIALGRASAVAASQIGDIPNVFITDTQQMFHSTMSSQRLCLGLLLEEFAGSLPEKFEKLNTFAELLNPLLLESMDTQGPVQLWRDINPILRAVRTQCQSLFSLLMSQGELDTSLLPKLPTTIEGDPCQDGSEVFTLQKSRELATKTIFELKSKLSPETQIRMSEILEDGRKNLISSIEEAETNLENRNTSVRATSAAAYIMLNQGKLPNKLNPIIRSLMDDIKTESIPLLHERTSKVLTRLIGALISSNRQAAANKIVKNLCAFLCVDVNEAPEFDSSQEDCILSLKRDDIKLDNKNVAEMLRKEREKQVSFIKRTGAVLTLSKLSINYGSNLFETLPEIITQMSQYLVNTDVASLDKASGQGLIDNLAIMRTLLPYLDSTLWKVITEYLPYILAALFSPFPVIRHVASRCLATFCKTVPSEGITFVVREILSKSLIDAASVVRRQGSIEAIFHMMLQMSEDILPYVVFFIVPVLGRMSDSNNAIRMIAATTFASIIKLVPLESGVQDPDDIPQELLEGKEREREFIGQMMDPTRIQQFELPIAVNAELRQYQQEGINWLAFLNKYHLHGILCDDMGLGKTLQTICMIASDHVNRAEDHKKTGSDDTRRLPSLIICPTTLTGHWVEEFNKYVNSLNVVALVGSPRSRQLLLSSGKIKNADIVITSYDTARNEVSRLSQYDWNYCVLDEGHIIKNSNSKLSKAVKMYKAYHRLVLTGTPIQNNVLELWSLFDFLMPGFLGNEKSFNERFSKPIAARASGKASPKDQELATLALEALHKQVLPFTLRRLKEDVLDDLPPKIIQDYYCDLNEVQRKLYDQFTNVQRSSIEKDAHECSEGTPGKKSEQAKSHIFQALQYMRKLCNHPAFVNYTKAELQSMALLNADESPKLMALQQLLKDCGIGSVENMADGVPEAMSQHRALIFCQQRDMLDLVEKSLLQTKMPSVSYLRIDGSIPGPARQNLVSKFNDDPSIDVLLLTTHVGGLGLNLTGADTVIFVEHDWNPMNDLQAMDRAHRLGQKRVVNVYRLITRNTLEERIMGLQQFKLNVASSVINQQNKGLMSMGTDQILDLFSSSADSEVPSTGGSIKDDDATKEVNKLNGKNDASVGLGELWDESEYTEEYNIDKFIKSLKK